MIPWAAHPAFAPLARWLSRLRTDEPPDVGTLNAWAAEEALSLHDGRALRFAALAVSSALDYEAIVRRDALIATRERNWHDAFNALAWLALPKTKAALNAVHVGEGRASTPNLRTRLRDAATLLDESGLLLACDDPKLPPLLAGHAWRELFVERAAAASEHFRPVVIGHGLLDKLRAPYAALTAKVLVLDVPSGSLADLDGIDAFDECAAIRITSGDVSPARLLALPIVALPGWDVERIGARRFDDVSVFRPKVLR